MDEKEIWLPVVGYEGKYQVSDWGNVRSLDYNRTGRTQVLKPVMDGGGYQFVHLCKDGKRRMKKVHRLVAEAFIPNPNGLPEVNHIDECKSNNAASNLEWCDRSYNNNYGTRNVRDAAVKGKSVQQFSKDGALIAVWSSMIEAWRQTGINYSNICKCCKDKYRTAGGFVWRYAQ